MLSRRNWLILLPLVAALLAFVMSCSAGAPERIVEKFIYHCQMGSWSEAEAMLSERGVLYFEQSGQSLQQTYWPVLGLASTIGVDSETIKLRMDEAVKVTSSQAETTSAEIMVNIRNTVMAGESASSIKSKMGVKSLDVNVQFKLVQEANRWKVEKISILGGEEVKNLWERAAKMSPASFTV